ncbi:MAG: selenium-dependent xanthine dehydrogenase [Candidatus Metalachnospira sp.]|nr:selenium-dependent xanthine dehydrogenase [Candidatus Metalachnospira sp.]
MSKVWINGKEVEAAPNRKLMDVLRNDCHLKSVKDGCSEGACGTCTVVIDGKATKTCVQTMARMEGKHVLTVEGLTDYEKEVFVYAFGEAGAVQCGFCIPGMVMCAKALFDNNLQPSRKEIAYAMRNNICRCTGYKKIVVAIELAAAIFRGEKSIPENEGSARIGNNYHRIDVRDKVLGTGQYIDDLEIEGMTYASAVRSAYPHAKIISIHTEKAAALQGVIAVLRAEDIPGSRQVGHLKQDWDVMIAEGETTHFLGDAICLVVAETEEILAQAKKLVEIEYEVLPVITCVKEALAEDAPMLHKDGNIVSHQHFIRGNVEEAIKNAKYTVTEHFETPWTEHAYMEPECSISMPYKDGVFIYSSDQGIYSIRKECALMLGLPEEKLIVENKLIGGGFGGREDAVVQPLAALAAYRTGRIVKVKLTRKESMLIHPKRHAFSIDLTIACDENGRITALKEHNLTDNGAYASLGGPVLQRACIHASGPYNFHNIDVEGLAVYTNNPPAGAFRGFGVTQTCFAIESSLNLLAEKAGLSEWEIRFRNAVRPGDVLPNGQIADASTGIAETLLAIKDIFEQNKYVGISCAIKNAGVGIGLPDYGRCRLAIEDGKVHIHAGATCIGQGLGTVLTQVVGEVLDIEEDDIIYHFPNSSDAPDSGNTSGSRQTLITGEATRRAAEKIREKLQTCELSSLNGTEYYGEYYAKTDMMGTDKKNPVSHVAYGYATHVCILNEDGTIQKIVAVHDVGKAVNPKNVEGQIEGGVVMSLGYALTEQYPLKNGVPTASFGTLGIMRADKVPDVESIIIEKPGIAQAFGAIGIGEITSIPTAAAVQGAYYKLDGKFRTSLPLEDTPYRPNRKKNNIL